MARMRSMTGFGLGEAPLGEGRLALEVRSLNHRYLDLRVRLPPELGDHSSWLEQRARERLTRGRYDIGARLSGGALGAPMLSMERARAAYQALLRLRDELAPDSTVPISAIAPMADALTVPADVNVEVVRAALDQALGSALGALDEMRSIEGSALAKELAERLTAARSLVAEIKDRSDGSVAAYRSRLRSRLERLLVDTPVAFDSGRLEMELAIMADRSDVTEELVRLGSHFDQFEKLLGSAEPIGRRLDFLLQETAREVNTLGSKSQDGDVSHLVVALKAELERIREQVQNVE
jgi:uncharacterized protein (TIGR00255 family)